MRYQDFPPALLILSPRLSLAGDPSSSVVGINTTTIADGSFVYSAENKSEYQLDKTDNTTPPDGNLVLAPLTGPGRWFKRTFASDHKVSVDALDTLANYLGAKIIPGANVMVTPVDLGGGNLALSIAASVPPGSSDHKVLVDGADTTADFLRAKLAQGALIALATLNPGLNEQVQIGIAPSLTNGQAMITIGGVPTWSTNFQDQNLFTTGSYYAGSTATGGEAAGSVVAVQTGATAVRGIVSWQHSGDAVGATFYGLKSRGTRAVPVIVQAGDVVSRFTSAGYDGANYIPSAQISFEVTGVPALGSISQAIVFRSGTSAAPSERFRIEGAAATYAVVATANMTVTGVLSVQGGVAIGAVSTTGDIRGRSGFFLAARNAANTQDVNLVNWNGSNQLLLGSDSFVVDASLRALTTVRIVQAGAVQMTFDGARVEVSAPSEFSFKNTILAPVIMQQAGSAAVGQNLWVHAQGMTGGATDKTGGILILTGGFPDLNGLPGAARLGIVTTTSIATVATLAEATMVVANQRVLSLARTAGLTAVQMPVNTGDGVIYVGDAQTDPTANAVGGHIYYSDAARPAWRFNSINLRLDGTSASASAGGGAAVPGTVANFLQIDIGGTTFKIPYFAA